MVRVTPLGSGSSGNATLVSFGKTHLLVDAGLSARDLAARLTGAGVPPSALSAILLTHEYYDHVWGFL